MKGGKESGTNDRITSHLFRSTEVVGEESFGIMKEIESTICRIRLLRYLSPQYASVLVPLHRCTSHLNAGEEKGEGGEGRTLTPFPTIDLTEAFVIPFLSFASSAR